MDILIWYSLIKEYYNAEEFITTNISGNIFNFKDLP